MIGFEPRTSGIGSDRSTNWVTTTTQSMKTSIHYNFATCFVALCLMPYEQQSENKISQWFTLHSSLAASVARLGDFWKFIATNFIIKLAQVFGNLVNYLKYVSF